MSNSDTRILARVLNLLPFYTLTRGSWLTSSMKLIQQSKRLKIHNLEPCDKVVRQLRRHSALLPNTVRCLICGPSNCGKTNVVVCLLLDVNGLKYQNVYLYSKTPFQPKYEYLGKVFKPVKDLGYFVFSDSSDIVKPQVVKQNSIFIFDDVACDKQDVIRDYFSMGRHSSVDCFYLCQTYTRIPKQLIRDNANLLILFKQDETNLKHVYDDHVNTDMTFSDFKKMCSLCWIEKFEFLVIDKDCEINEGRYRKGFDVYIKSKT